MYRSNPCKSRLVPVSEPDSRPSWSSVTARVTSVSESRPPKKSLPPSVPPSSSPNSPSFPSDVATGVPTSVSLTLSPPKSPASVVQSPSVSSLPPRNRSRCFPRRQEIVAARWCPRRIHIICWKHKDFGEHPQGHLCRRQQLIRFLDSQPVEGDQAYQKSPGGVW